MFSRPSLQEQSSSGPDLFGKTAVQQPSPSIGIPLYSRRPQPAEMSDATLASQQQQWHQQQQQWQQQQQQWKQQNTVPARSTEFVEWCRIRGLDDETMAVLDQHKLDSIQALSLLTPELIETIGLPMGQSLLLEEAVKCKSLEKPMEIMNAASVASQPGLVTDVLRSLLDSTTDKAVPVRQGRVQITDPELILGLGGPKKGQAKDILDYIPIAKVTQEEQQLAPKHEDGSRLGYVPSVAKKAKSDSKPSWNMFASYSNGIPICKQYNLSQGRCKYDPNCKFAHVCDIPKCARPHHGGAHSEN